MQVEQVTALIAAIGGLTGLWGFLTLRAKQSHERQKALDNRHAEFNENLKDQVDHLSAKVDELVNDKEELLVQIGALREELAEARATIKHFQEIMRMRMTDSTPYTGTDRRSRDE